MLRVPLRLQVVKPQPPVAAATPVSPASGKTSSHATDAAPPPASRPESPPRDVAPRLHELRAAASAVIREMTADPGTTSFGPPPLATTNAPEPVELSRTARAFRAPQRPVKQCGRMVRVQVMDRVIVMPASYACEDKEVEYTDAPGAGKAINVIDIPLKE